MTYKKGPLLAFVVEENHRAYCWGSNQFEQLGNCSFTGERSLVPVEVDGITNAASVSE